MRISVALQHVLLAGLCAWVSAGPAAGQEPDRAADHESLRQLMKRTATAINTADLKALESCLAEEFAFTTVDQSCITNQAGLAAYFGRLSSPDSPVASVQIAPRAQFLTRFVGPDAGYCGGDSVDVYTLKDGRVFRIPSRWTAVVLRERGAWRAAAVHTGINFIDNPVLAARALSVWGKLGILLHLKTPPYERH